MIYVIDKTSGKIFSLVSNYVKDLRGGDLPLLVVYKTTGDDYFCVEKNIFENNFVCIADYVPQEIRIDHIAKLTKELCVENKIQQISRLAEELCLLSEYLLAFTVLLESYDYRESISSYQLVLNWLDTYIIEKQSRKLFEAFKNRLKEDKDATMLR